MIRTGRSRVSRAWQAPARLLLLAVLAVAAGGLLVDPSPAGADGCPDSNRPNTLQLAVGSGQTAQLGKAFQTNFQVVLANTNGCPLTGNLAGINVDFVAPSSGASGFFASSGSSVAVVGTDAQGIATAPAFTANFTAGSYSVDAQSDYGTVNLYLTNTASGLAASITATGTTSQEAAVNSQYPAPLQAQVLDGNGHPVQGETVTFAITTGPSGASASFLGGGQATTDSNGLATSPPLLANGSPGRFTATASTADLAAVATYSLDNHAATATLSTTGDRRQTATVDKRYRRPLQVRVLDATGAPIEGASVTFTITAAASGAGASFLDGSTQASGLTDADGRISSPPLVADKIAGHFAATASVSGSTRPLAYALRNLAGAPSTIAAGAADGESTRVGSRFPIRLAVTVTDKDGNPVQGATVTFAAPKRRASGYFIFRRPRRARIARVRTDAGGVAVAPTFTANRRSGGYVVTAVVKGTSKRTAFALVNERG